MVKIGGREINGADLPVWGQSYMGAYSPYYQPFEGFSHRKDMRAEAGPLFIAGKN
jgi:hypothetical protein